MAERHTTSFDYFDLRVDVADDGTVRVEFSAADEGLGRISMDWDDLREALDFIGKHGLALDNPWFGEFDQTLEGAEVAAA
jgi:hypothetical protein